MLDRFRKLIVVFAVLSFLPAAAAHAGTVAVDTNGQLPSLAPVLKKVLPGVVSIAIEGRVAVKQNPLLSDPFFQRFFGVPQTPRERKFQAVGSGVIVDPHKGYILTNNHVIERADSITVTLSDGRHLKAKKIGADPATDIAVVQVDPVNLHGLKIGNSDTLRVGDYVIAVGNPFGLQQTVTSGIVSALGRSGLGVENYENFIQTDASINPGNSGGALVNLRGELVGINTAIVGPSGGNVGIGFAIPINMAKDIMTQLIAHGAVHRGQLGVGIQDLTPDLAAAMNANVTQGAIVTRVNPGSPAAKAGIQVGDVITAIDGEKVRNSLQLHNRVGLMSVGAKVTLDVVHKGKPTKVEAVLAAQQSQRVEVPNSIPRLAGVVLGPIQPGSPLYGKANGAVVLEIKQGSPAAEAGLMPGDVIVAVDQQPVNGPQSVIAIAGKIRGPLLLQIARGDTGYFITIG